MNDQRPSEFPDVNDALVQAARYNDAASEEHGLPATCEQLGIDLDTLRHVAEQRAMRIMLVKKGRIDELKSITATTRYQALRFSPEEQEEIMALSVLYLDGIALGWKARELHDA